MVRLLTRISSESAFPTDALSPEDGGCLLPSPPIKVMVSHESRGLLERAFDLCFGEQAEELTMPTRDPSLAGRGKALVSRSEPFWREAPGAGGLTSGRPVA